MAWLCAMCLIEGGFCEVVRNWVRARKPGLTGGKSHVLWWLGKLWWLLACCVPCTTKHFRGHDFRVCLVFLGLFPG